MLKEGLTGLPAGFDFVFDGSNLAAQSVCLGGGLLHFQFFEIGRTKLVGGAQESRFQLPLGFEVLLDDFGSAGGKLDDFVLADVDGTDGLNFGLHAGDGGSVGPLIIVAQAAVPEIEVPLQVLAILGKLFGVFSFEELNFL